MDKTEVITVAREQHTFMVPADLPDPRVRKLHDRFEALSDGVSFRPVRPDHEFQADKESVAHIIVPRE